MADFDVVAFVSELPLWVQIAAGVVSALIAAILLLEYAPRPSNAPPTYHPGLPVLGSFVNFAKDPVGLVRKGYDEKGNCFTLRMFGQNLTFLLGPNAHDVLFSSDDEQVSQAEVYRFMTPVFGPGIVYDAPLAKMREQLKWMSQALRPDAIKSYPGKIQKEAEDFFKGMEGGRVNLFDLYSRLIVLTASRCLMGDEIREHLWADVSQLYHDLDAGITPLSIFFPYAPIPQHWKRDKAHRAMIELFSKVVRDRRTRFAKDPTLEKPNDVLQKFLDSKYRDGSQSSDTECAGLMIALLFAGQHTSSITSTWTTLLAMGTPGIRERVTKEVEETLKGGGAMDDQRAQKLELLERCMVEGIRLFPPLIFLMRKTQVPVQCGPYTIPQGDIIFASPAVSHRLPEGSPDNAFAHPDKFDPDRFADPKLSEKSVRAKKAYIGFGAGRHSCMGEPFGKMQAKVVVSTLLKYFDVKLLKPIPKPSYHAMVVGPEHENCYVELIKRKVPLGN